MASSMTTMPELLTAFEECPRKAFWRRGWERSKLDGNALLQAAIRAGVTSERTDFGEAAGEEAYGLGNEPGLETSHYDLHGEVVHLACIADLVATAIRKATDLPWKIPEPLASWQPSCFLSPDGTHLRRVALV